MDENDKRMKEIRTIKAIQTAVNSINEVQNNKQAWLKQIKAEEKIVMVPMTVLNTLVFALEDRIQAEKKIVLDTEALVMRGKDKEQGDYLIINVLVPKGRGLEEDTPVKVLIIKPF